jgi:hypothetical protein
MLLVQFLLSLLEMLTKHNLVQKMNPSKLMANCRYVGNGTNRKGASLGIVDISTSAMCLVVVVLTLHTSIHFIPLQPLLQKPLDSPDLIKDLLLCQQTDCLNASQLINLDNTCASASPLIPVVVCNNLYDLSVDSPLDSTVHSLHDDSVTCLPVCQITCLTSDIESSVAGQSKKAVCQSVVSLTCDLNLTVEGIDYGAGAAKSVPINAHRYVPATATMRQKLDTWTLLLKDDFDSEYLLAGVANGFRIISSNVSPTSALCKNYN